MTFICKQFIIILQHLESEIIMLQKEVTMKTKLLLIAILATMVHLQSDASVTVDQATNANYLRNNGFSAQTADLVNVGKARALGEEYYTEDEAAYRKQNKFVRFWRKLYVYTDPAAEDYSFYHHDTDTTPSYTDF